YAGAIGGQRARTAVDGAITGFHGPHEVEGENVLNVQHARDHALVPVVDLDFAGNRAHLAVAEWPSNGQQGVSFDNAVGIQGDDHFTTRFAESDRQGGSLACVPGLAHGRDQVRITGGGTADVQPGVVGA